ncbi:hypothetical protein E2C01_089300 [Portunus trituberculatus]|uniref:Uncharacterized protein n=1 Tax=Portunus trituberculatus TaxID=210409 RepID=A0A5B7JIQ3_PORTR|nr:hypothetical protein [Portunus trituberculatus]
MKTIRETAGGFRKCRKSPAHLSTSPPLPPPPLTPLSPPHNHMQGLKLPRLTCTSVPCPSPVSFSGYARSGLSSDKPWTQLGKLRVTFSSD